MTDFIGLFTEAMKNAGLDPAEIPTADSVFRRIRDNQDKPGKKDLYYVLHGDGVPAGNFGHWSRLPDGQNWQAKPDNTLNPQERSQIKVRIEQSRAARDKARDEVRAACRIKAGKMLEAAHDVSADHDYLVKKKNKPYEARQLKDMLLIPVYKSKALTGLQIIMPDGVKKFLTGTEKAGAYLAIKGKGKTVYLVEGWSTGCTIHELTGATVIICFDCGNLEAVSKEIRATGPEYDMVLVADNDRLTDGNPGLTKARAAALATGARLARPDFPCDDGTDANDLMRISGGAAVMACLKAAAPVTTLTGTPSTLATLATLALASDQWPEPLPIETKMEPEPYPLNALPDTIRLAVEEVLEFVKAPAPLVVSAALAALSMAIQPHADVMRADKLSGPSSLFLLTIAESGERKSTCDGFFTKTIREYEAKQAEAAKPLIRQHEAEYAAWDMKYSGVKDSIRAAAKGGKPTIELEAELLQLQQDKPEPPRVPRIMYADATPEELKHKLAKQWPSGAVVSSEAGVVFGSHGMGKDSAMRNLATLNQLWDGTDIQTDRRTSESFIVKGARLTMALQVQESTLRAFFKSSGELARGTGFLARFLIAWPESTQGFRPFTEAPENWPHLAAFNSRIAEILNQDAPIDDDGALYPVMSPLSPDAKKAWVAFHDAIESELVSGGELFDIRDVASKTADNAARLACLFQGFTCGGGAVGLDAFESASMITAWHLSEARRFFGGLALPQELADATRLDNWIIEYCRKEKTGIVPIAKLQQCGPCGLRSKVAIDAAAEELEELSRARRVKDGKRRTIHVNPALLAGVL